MSVDRISVRFLIVTCDAVLQVCWKLPPEETRCGVKGDVCIISHNCSESTEWNIVCLKATLEGQQFQGYHLNIH